MEVSPDIDTPEDPTWEVWADELQMRGDPRGELIALELLPEPERSAAHSDRLTVLQRVHIERFEASVGKLLLKRWRTREVSRWRFGYPLELILTKPRQYARAPHLSPLFASEELRYLRSLRVELTPALVEPLIEALEQQRALISEFVCCDAFALPGEHDWNRLWKALPRLSHVTFSPANIRVEQLTHPGLRSICLWTDGTYISAEALIALADNELPALEQLTCVGKVRNLGALLEQPSLCALFGRLAVFECESLLSSCLPHRATEQQLSALLQPLRHLPKGLRVICNFDLERAEVVRRLVPQLEFEFRDCNESLERHRQRHPRTPAPSSDA